MIASDCLVIRLGDTAFYYPRYRRLVPTTYVQKGSAEDLPPNGKISKAMISLPFRLSLKVHSHTIITLPLHGYDWPPERTESFDDGKNNSVDGQRVIASEQNEVYKYTTATFFDSPIHSYCPLPTTSILQQFFLLRK